MSLVQARCKVQGRFRRFRGESGTGQVSGSRKVPEVPGWSGAGQVSGFDGLNSRSSEAPAVFGHPGLVNRKSMHNKLGVLRPSKNKAHPQPGTFSPKPL